MSTHEIKSRILAIHASFMNSVTQRDAAEEIEKHFPELFIKEKPVKEYLGDNVYVEADNYGGIILTVENGLGPTEEISLEAEVIHALLGFLNIKLKR